MELYIESPSSHDQQNAPVHPSLPLHLASSCVTLLYIHSETSEASAELTSDSTSTPISFLLVVFFYSSSIILFFFFA